MRHCAKWMNTEIWSSKVFQTFQTAFKNSSDFHPWNAKCAKSHNSKTGSIDAWGIQVLAPALTLCHSSKIATGWPPVHLEVLERMWPVWPTNGVQVAVLCQLSRRHGLAANHKAMETMTTSSCSLRASQNGSENQLNQWVVDPSLIVRMWLCAIRCFLYSTFGCCWKHKIHIFPMFLLSGIWRDFVHIFRHTWVLGIIFYSRYTVYVVLQEPRQPLCHGDADLLTKSHQALQKASRRKRYEVWRQTRHFKVSPWTNTSDSRQSLIKFNICHNEKWGQWGSFQLIPPHGTSPKTIPPASSHTRRQQTQQTFNQQNESTVVHNTDSECEIGRLPLQKARPDDTSSTSHWDCAAGTVDTAVLHSSSNLSVIT
jgi:hypothetical protein